MSKLYPDLQNYENECSQTNCGQIFAKSTEITKDILEKFEETEIVPEKASLCGREFNTRQLWVLAGLSLLFSTSCLCTGLMFGTDTFDTYLLSNLILSNASATYPIWKGPLIKTYVKVHVFNYTNVREYESRLHRKLRVEEVGPYVYEETLERVNVHFHQNGTVSYQEKRDHKYRKDLSVGRESNETVVVPNLPLLGAASLGKKSFYVTRVAMSTLLKGLRSKPFLDLEIDRFLWGYDDTLFTLAKSVLSFQKKLPFDRIGLLAGRDGLSADVFNVHTGVKGIEKLQQVEKLNGKSSGTQWTSEDCNKIKGSDGTSFSPYDIREKRPISVYNKDVCRALPLVYDKDVKMFNGRISAHKYVLPFDSFDAPERNANNSCFCNKETRECSPQGLFNAEACSFGAPVYISFPHFYGADASVRDAVAGLNKNPTDVESFVYVHPTLGFTMAGTNRLQLNVHVQKSFGMEQLDVFADDIILPMAWFELGLEETDLPDVVKDSIYLASVTAPAIEACFKYGSLLASVVTLTAILIVLRSKWIKRQRKLYNPS
ncbi:hypothetical protein FQR65_LT16238 [Abscondita terminalis]|nr:hypothetical protein FQR65_LT16238 [Abscondita terminalis]